MKATILMLCGLHAGVGHAQAFTPMPVEPYKAPTIVQLENPDFKLLQARAKAAHQGTLAASAAPVIWDDSGNVTVLRNISGDLTVNVNIGAPPNRPNDRTRR